MKSSIAYKYEIVSMFLDADEKAHTIYNSCVYLGDAYDCYKRTIDMLKRDDEWHCWFVTLYAVDSYKSVTMKLESEIESI